MNIISDSIAWMSNFAISVMSATGYFGVFFMMVLESMIFPIPSELVMPFAGFLAVQGDLNFLLVCIFATLGSLVGSSLSYFIGKYGGNKIVLKYGRYILVDEDDLIKTENWFRKKGEKTIFIGRLIPVVRHLISIPAGIGRMNFKKFCLYTAAGAMIWNSFLAYLGYALGKNWDKVRQYTEPLSIAVAVLLALAGSYYLYHFLKDRIKKKR